MKMQERYFTSLCWKVFKTDGTTPLTYPRTDPRDTQEINDLPFYPTKD
jgi:hypothetical protein